MIIIDNIDFKKFVDNLVTCYSKTKRNSFIFKIKQLKLEKVIDYVNTNNKGDVNIYHNSLHCEDVAMRALEIFEATNIASTSHNYIFDKCALIIACLFHDFNHEGYKTSDDCNNIRKALDGFDTFLERNTDFVNDFKARFNFDGDPIVKLRLAVRHMIISTEFPFIYEPVTLLEKCIRDADVLTACDTNFIYFLNGLHLELNEKKKLQTNNKDEDFLWVYKFEDFIKDQKNFISKRTLFTEYANEVFTEKLAGNFTDLFIQYKEFTTYK